MEFFIKDFYIEHFSFYTKRYIFNYFLASFWGFYDVVKSLVESGAGEWGIYYITIVYSIRFSCKKMGLVVENLPIVLYNQHFHYLESSFTKL